MGLRPVKLGAELPAAGEHLLLQAALLPPERAVVAWRQWLATHDLDDVHQRGVQLLPAVAANLPAHMLGDEAARIQGIRRRSWYTNQRLLAAIGGAVDVLDHAGVPSTLCKGAALLCGTVVDMGARSMYDGDLIVPADRLDDARGALRDAGWREKRDRPLPSWKHALVLIGPEERQLDLHRSLLHPRFLRRPDPPSWWDRRVPCTVGGRPSHRLHPGDELVASVVASSGFVDGSAVRWPYDVVSLARSHENDLWPVVEVSAAEIGYGPLVAAALDYCRAEYSLEVPDGVVERLAAEPMSAQLRWERWRMRYVGRSRWRLYADAARGRGQRPSVRVYRREVADMLGDRSRVGLWWGYQQRMRARRRERRTSW